MSKWIRFKSVSGSDWVVVPASARRMEDGEVSVWDSVDTEFKVHLDDADRVWGILCGLCEPDHSGDANKKVDAKPPPLTYSRRTLENGDTEIVLRSFTHERGRGNLCASSSGVTIRSFEYPEWCRCTSLKLLYVTGKVDAEDKRPILIPAADWPNVKQALDEYGAQEVQV